jgi:hypothetical protein
MTDDPTDYSGQIIRGRLSGADYSGQIIREQDFTTENTKNNKKRKVFVSFAVLFAGLVVNPF